MSLPGASGLAEYAFRWESFNLVHRWIEAAFARHGTFDESWSDPRRLARACALVAWLALAIFAWRRRLGLVRCAGLLFGGALVLTPTLHPWYLAWSVPFLAFRPLLSFSALTLLSPLLYWPLARWRAERVWSEPRWLVPLVAGAFWGLLAVDLARSRRHRP
jgi:hypothetical protein